MTGSLEQSEKRDEREIRDPREPREEQNGLADEAIKLLNVRDQSFANSGKSATGDQDLGLPVMNIQTSDIWMWPRVPNEVEGQNESLDSRLGTEIKHGDVADVQDVLGDVKSPEDYKQLQETVRELDRNAPEGVSYDVAKDENGRPVLEISYKDYNENFGPKAFSKYDITIAENSAMATQSTTWGIVPRTKVDPQLALDKVQAQERFNGPIS